MNATKATAEGCGIGHAPDELGVQIGVDPARRHGVATDALRSVIEHCSAPGAGGYTPADFRERVSQATLDKLAAEEFEVEDPDE